MKKRILTILAVGELMILLLTGCNTNTNSYENSSFICVESGSLSSSTLLMRYKIVYHKETKVMYAIYENGAFTLLVNPDGTPMIYEGN